MAETWNASWPSELRARVSASTSSTSGMRDQRLKIILPIIAMSCLCSAVARADCAPMVLPKIPGPLQAPLTFRFVQQTCVTPAGAPMSWANPQPPTLDPAGDSVVCTVSRQPIQRSWICFEHK
jgi:hypothetical protein